MNDTIPGRAEGNKNLIEERLVLIPEVDGISCLGDGARVVDGLAGEEDITNNTAGLVDVGVQFGRFVGGEVGDGVEG